MAQTLGTIVQSIGAVIDIEFPREHMPKVYDALILEDSGENTLAEKGLTFEVEQQLGDGITSQLSLRVARSDEPQEDVGIDQDSHSPRPS